MGFNQQVSGFGTVKPLVLTKGESEYRVCSIPHSHQPCELPVSYASSYVQRASFIVFHLPFPILKFPIIKFSLKIILGSAAERTQAEISLNCSDSVMCLVLECSVSFRKMHLSVQDFLSPSGH